MGDVAAGNGQSPSGHRWRSTTSLSLIHISIYNLRFDGLVSDDTEPLHADSAVIFTIEGTDAANTELTRFGSWQVEMCIRDRDMSLVGPRPEVPYHVEHFKEEIPRYLVRQQVRPGCTGWAQIHGLRGDTDIAERIRYDIWYIENWTVALDIKIIFRTVFGGKMVNDEKLQ